MVIPHHEFYLSSNPSVKATIYCHVFKHLAILEMECKDFAKKS